MLYAINEAAINGWVTQNASGTAALALAEAGDAKVAILDTGSAPLALASSGVSNPPALGSGSADMQLSLNGNAAPIWLGLGSAQMQLVATAVPASIAYGLGSAQLLLSAKWDLPNQIVTPTAFNATHQRRLMLAGEERRMMMVQPEIIRPVQAELRTMRVSAEKRV